MYKIKIFIFVYFTFILLITQTSNAQYINKGMWYHQQPTSQADSDTFFGGSSTYEGWCGPTALAMIFHYYIPNIHRILYDRQGAVDYHSSDNRGGLTSADPYCYNSSTTYPFCDFLAHNYLGYHVTISGVGYSSLMTIVAGVSADVDDYLVEYGYVQLSSIRNYLDDGYLIVVNTKEGHYITVTGWEGSTTDSDQRFYYIWDGWKSALGMESYTSRTDLVGNKNNMGTAQNISVYTITGTTLNSHFRDQMGDGSVLAIKFTLNNPLEDVSEVGMKGIMVWNSTIKSKGISNFISDISAHSITDLFILVRDISGILDTQALNEIIPEAHLLGIKVHAWLDVLNDTTAALSGKYTTTQESWVDARDTSYRNYFVDSIITQLCKIDIDGIYLDYLRYPRNACSYNGAKEAITEYCESTRQKMDNNGKVSSLLSSSIMPEDAEVIDSYGQDMSGMSQYLDFLVPQTFTHSYKEGPKWVGNQINYLANNITNECKILSGIQSLDDDENYITPYELKQCINFASENGSSGIIFNRYPLESWQWELSDQLSVTTGLRGDKNLENQVPLEFELSQNYPNPFNPITNIQFKIPKASFVTLKVYDILGKEIAVLVNENKNVGTYQVGFNASNLSSGIYLYKLTVDKNMFVKKMIVLK